MALVHLLSNIQDKIYSIQITGIHLIHLIHYTSIVKINTKFAFAYFILHILQKRRIRQI